MPPAASRSRNEEADNGTAGLDDRIHIQARYNINPVEWYTWLFSHLQFPPDCAILELGCGPGDLWFKHLDRLDAGWRILLSDLSADMLLEARRRLMPELGQFCFGLIDAQAVPALDHRFDFVIAIGLLDLVSQRVEVLDEVHRLLKPGHRFYATAGGHTHLQEIESLVRPFLPDADYGGDAHRFGIDNGEKILSPWFAEVTRHIYSGDMVFDRAEPIVTYVLSEKEVASALVGEKERAFESFVRDKLASEGEICVTSQKALFVAR
jgi:ubiquinone/menaquinone biosynthesis C-methylase UbiE